MPLKLYEIHSTLKSHPDCRAIIKDISLDDKIFAFFIMNQGVEEEIEKTELEFILGKGYTLENIEKTDYIFTFSALLFSKKFVDSIGEILKKEMQFFPCKLICNDVALDWYVAKIIHRFPVVDKELSVYRSLTDGKRILHSAKYRKDIEEQFYVARDSESITYFVVSDLFKNLCEKNGLMINIEELFR